MFNMRIEDGLGQDVVQRTLKAFQVVKRLRLHAQGMIPKLKTLLLELESMEK